MADSSMEDHAFGVELQLTELVEEQKRAQVQGRHDDAARLGTEIAELQTELARTAARIVGEV